MKYGLKKILANALCIVALCFGASFAQTGSTKSASSTPSTGATSAAPQSTGINTPLFLGGMLGFGSGTGVGTERGLGLREIEPLIGIWFPHTAFFRAGYGFYDFKGESEEGTNIDIEHSNLNVELGMHFMGDVYIVGDFSRVKELSDEGDVSWNEWGVGIGTLVNIFSKTMLFAEIGYRWVSEHYDPFLNKTVSGSRLQLNVGFAAYVY